MKKILILTVLLFSFYVQAQTFDITSGNVIQDIPTGGYIKDIDGQFDKFSGTWVWTNGDEKVTFKLQKVTHQLFTEYSSYEDYMIGDYSYTKNYGNEVVVNTINPALSLLPEFHPMYTGRPESDTTIDFIFTDVIINKGYCSAIFEFLPGSTTQMKLILKNSDGPIGFKVDEGEPIDIPPPFNFGFTIPNNIVLTKQP
ncbi:DUF6705 family protein [Flavobacterium soli]|uniref:DUF6705 family protein n=1 Tax=Flavobacterium soli TaxID=344881 RepID=UPI000403B2D1|nr:DUF6705 family protein [Flavobacterium soli]